MMTASRWAQTKMLLPDYSPCTLLSTCLRKWVVTACRNSLFLFLSKPPHQRIRVSPRTICPEKRAHENIPPSAPNLQTPDAEERRCRLVAQQSDTQHPRVVLNESSAPVTFAPPPLLFLRSHLRPGRLRAPDLTPQNIVRCDRAAPSLPTICSKCVEPSVSKTGRPRFPFSLGLVSLFSGASLLPEWLLGLGSGPTKGFLKWRSWG